MTTARGVLAYLLAGGGVAPIVAAADGERGLWGAAAAWLVCLVPLLRWPHRSRVAGAESGRRIGGKWELLQTGAMLFRLTWVLGVGALLYQGLGESLGVGFWIALIVFYQIVLAMSVVRSLRARPGAVAG